MRLNVRERNLKEAEVESIVHDPVLILPSRRHGRHDVIGYVRGRAIRIVYAESPDALWIITVMLVRA